MNKQETIDLIRERILPDYERVLGEIEGMRYKDIHEYLYSIYMHRGICYYSRWALNKSMSNDVFDSKLYICSPPDKCFNKKEVIKSLETRIRSMKDIIYEADQEN